MYVLLRKLLFVLLLIPPGAEADVPESLQRKWRGLFNRQPLHFSLNIPQPDSLEALLDSAQQRYAKYRYIDDMTLYGVADYWATPLELEDIGAGDCEDFAMGKYYYLADSGISPVRMKLAVLYTKHNIWHAVLVVDGKYILDNNSTKVERIDYLEGQFKHVYYLSHKQF